MHSSILLNCGGLEAGREQGLYTPFLAYVLWLNVEYAFVKDRQMIIRSSVFSIFGPMFIFFSPFVFIYSVVRFRSNDPVSYLTKNIE